MGKIKLGKRRWNEKTEDLEEWRVCKTCGIKYWAGSAFEYGNFYERCFKCTKEKRIRDINTVQNEYAKRLRIIRNAKIEQEKTQKNLKKSEELARKLGL